MPQTTYIFGAGASKHAGYPLASTMGRDLIEAMRGSGDQTLSGYAELAVETFGETPNVEDLFTSLQARINKAGTTAAPDGELPNLRSALLYRIGAWFRQIRGSAPAYQAFASRIASPGDTVLTFNYDDSVEKELNRSAKWNLSTGYGFPFSSSNKPSDVMVLKLHGSVNWLASMFGGIRGFGRIDPDNTLGERPVMLDVDAKYLGCEQLDNHRWYQGTTLSALIYPTRSKEFFFTTPFGPEWKPFWDLIWGQAKEQLQRSSAVVICGYSLPAADERARELLFDNIPKAAAIEVVCGNDSDRIMEEFNAARFEDVKSCPIFFEEWVKRRAEAQL